MELIFLHGTAASGKLTTARALEALVGYPVFHNHLVVDLLSGIFQFGSEPFVRLREEFWLAVFTDAARAAVEAHNGRVRFVHLAVSAAEQERRIGNESRKEFQKLSDLGTLRTLRGQARDIERPPADLEIDTDVSSAADSAALIVQHFALTPAQAVPRYPAG